LQVIPPCRPFSTSASENGFGLSVFASIVFVSTVFASIAVVEFL